MRQAIVGVSIFLGLQIALFLVLFGVTVWEGRQLDRPITQTAPVPPDRSSEGSPPVPPPRRDQDLPLSA
jgi:hypothetical protein